MLKTLVPVRLRRRLRNWQRRVAFDSALKRFTRLVRSNEVPDDSLLKELIYGWDNSGWSAMEEYIEACLRAARSADAPILECGSGLTTVLLGLLMERSGIEVWSLEHSKEWADRVNEALKRFNVTCVRLCVSPLRDYGEFSWYDPPLERMPKGFSLVICDGPPADTAGGRYGLVPVMRDRLLPSCTILLDDGERAEEQRIARLWASELSASVNADGTKKPFLRLRLPARQ